MSLVIILSEIAFGQLFAERFAVSLSLSPKVGVWLVYLQEVAFFYSDELFESSSLTDKYNFGFFVGAWVVFYYLLN